MGEVVAPMADSIDDDIVIIELAARTLNSGTTTDAIIQGRRRLAIPIQDTCIAQRQPETITGPASSLPLVGVSLMTVVFLLGYFLRRRFQQVKPRDSFGFL